MNISALLPIRNGSQFIESQLPKILATLESDDQLVIVENGSEDNSAELLRKIGKTDSRINFFEIGNLGLVHALNFGIRESIHPWIARFDIDDEYPSSRLRKQRLKIGSEVSAIFADYRIETESGKDLGRMFSPLYSAPTKASLINSERTAHPVALVRKEAVIDVGGYLKEEFPAEDLGLWARLSKSGDFLSVSSVELRYRLRKASISGSQRETIFRVTNRLIETYRLYTLAISAIDQLDESTYKYREEDHGVERLLLHLRDLRHPLVWEKLSSSQRAKVSRELRDLATNLIAIKPTTSILFKKFRRDIYRITGA